jgi:hypothetical protein
MQMKALINTEPFTIDYNGKIFEVIVETIGPTATVYLVRYPKGAVYIALTRASGLNDPMFWATIPENIKRHVEAQVIGELIFQHLNRLP